MNPNRLIPTKENLPVELTALPRWLGWRRSGTDKKPCCAYTGEEVGWPKATMAFDGAREGAIRLGLDGLGFLPDKEDQLVFLDFDDCFAPDGALDPAVAAWMEHFQRTYSERTPSGNGLRVVVKAILTKNVSSHPLPDSIIGSSVELYAGSSNHFVTIIGDRYENAPLVIDTALLSVDKLLQHIRFDARAEESSGETTERAALRYLDRACAELSGMTDGRQSRTTQVCWWLGRIIGAIPKDPVLNFETVKGRITAALLKTHWPAEKFEVIERQLLGGMKHPVRLIDTSEPHDLALARIKALATDVSSEPLEMDLVLRTMRDMKLLTTPEREMFRVRVAARTRWRVSVLDAEIAKLPADDASPRFDPATAGVADVRTRIENLLDDDPNEADKKAAENTVWDYLCAHATIFCCYGGGYLLMNDGDGVPIAVARDDEDFNRLLIGFGVHPGSPTRERIGKFIQTKCVHEGTHTETRLSFHYDRASFTAYVACQRGKLIKVDKSGFDEVPNGTDGQLFIFPASWRPLLSKPLDEIGMPIDGPEEDFPKSDLCKRCLFVDGFIARYLFRNTKFDLQNLTEAQLRILIVAYILFLMMPGVVSERALLQSLGPSGSGKSFILELLGRLLVGSGFMLRPLPTDLKEFENQAINEYLVGFDNVSLIPAEIKDRFCQAVTGMEVVRRVLFTDKREMRVPSKATIMLSAINPPLPELEHMNRTITMKFEGREESGFTAREDLFKGLDINRDVIILNFLRRMSLAITGLDEQRNYSPTVSVRLASIATFILRIARHEGWEDKATELIDAWNVEQTGYSMQDDDVSTAIARWMGRDGWKPGIELTATMLSGHLCIVMDTASKDLSWRGSHLRLANIITRNLKVYESRFGLKRSQSTLRTSRGNYTYTFNPTVEQLREIQEIASYEKEFGPAIPF